MQIAAPTGPTELGKLLCATRMRLGKDLQRIADILHIRYNYLVAIEDGRYEDLPGQAYAIGFVRAYADHLGLDGDEIVRRCKEESAGVKHKSAFEIQMPAADSALPSGTLLLIAVIAGMLIYGVWYSLAGSDRSAVQLIQEVPDRLAAIADPQAIQAALPVTAPAAVETPPAEGVDPASGSEIPPTEPAAPDGETAVAAAAPAVTAQPVQPAPVTAAAALPILTDVLELRAKADVWITLRDAKAVERTQFLRKDEVLRLPEQGVTTLVTANAGDLEILVNGKAMPPLDAGLFARGVALDPQKLKGATAAPAPVPSSAGPAAPPPSNTSEPAAAKPASDPTPAMPAPSSSSPVGSASAPAPPTTAPSATSASETVAAKPAASLAPSASKPAQQTPASPPADATPAKPAAPPVSSSATSTSSTSAEPASAPSGPTSPPAAAPNTAKTAPPAADSAADPSEEGVADVPAATSATAPTAPNR